MYLEQVGGCTVGNNSSDVQRLDESLVDEGMVGGERAASENTKS